MNVGTICSRPIRSIARDETVRRAAMLMLEHHVGSLVVLGTDGDPVGLLTDRDIVTRCIAKEFDPDATTVAEVMSAPVERVPAAESVGDALERMARLEVRRLLVAEDGDPVGVVSLDDLLVAEHGAELGGVFAGRRPV